MTNNVLLELTTTVKPPKKFMVDGAEYDLLGVDHLSPAEEAEVMALFSRHGLLATQLSNEANENNGKTIAAKMRDTRLRILAKLTTLPLTLASKLPLSAQVKLLDLVQGEVGDDEEDGSETPSESDASAKEAAAPEAPVETKVLSGGGGLG